MKLTLISIIYRGFRYSGFIFLPTADKYPPDRTRIAWEDVVRAIPAAAKIIPHTTFSIG